MAPNRMIARWLRPALALFALGGLLALGGCGGGSGAPNNPYQPGPAAPGPLSVLPPILTAFSNTPTTLTISGGAAPFFVVSSNPAILPVAQTPSGNTIVLLPGSVTADTAVTITVQDAIGQRATSTVTVKAAPIFGTLTVKPSSAACGANLCSGQTGTASVTVTGPGGVGIPNRQVRFDVVDGDFAIQSNNPGDAAGVDADRRVRRQWRGNGLHSGESRRPHPAGDHSRHRIDDRQPGERSVHDRAIDRTIGSAKRCDDHRSRQYRLPRRIRASSIAFSAGRLRIRRARRSRTPSRY